jgi:hypothetical protein
MACHVPRGRVRVAGLGDDLDVRLALEHQPERTADDRVIVCEHD